MPQESSKSGPVGAQSDEIEVTREMIEAGTRAMLQFGDDQLLDDYEGVAVAVFTAMMRQRLQSSTGVVARDR